MAKGGRDSAVAPPLAFRGALALAMAAPVLSAPGMGEAPGALAVRGAAAMLAATVVWRVPRGVGRLVAAALALSCLSHALSILPAIDPVAAAWGTPAGRIGLATVAASAVVALGAALEPETARRWCAGACAVASLVALLPIDVSYGSAAASWVALVGVALCTWIAARERRAGWWAAAGVCLAALLVRRDPAGLVGLWLGGAVAIAVVRDEADLGPRGRRIATAAFVATVFLPLAALAFALAGVLADTSAGPVWTDRLAAEPVLFERGVRASVALDAGRARPWLGAGGGGGFVFAWDYFFPPRILDVAPHSMDASDAGNAYLHAFAERGGLGALSEVLLLIAGFLTVAVRRRQGELDPAAATALAGLVVARGAHGLLAGPDVVGLATTGVLLGLCVGWGAPYERRQVRASPGRVVAGLSLAAALVIPPMFGAPALDPLAAHVRAVSAAELADDVAATTDDAEIDAAAADLVARVDAIERDVRSARALARLAVAAHELRRRDDLLLPALTRLETAIEWAPTRADLSVLRYDLLRALGRIDEALEWAEDAFMLAPDWAPAIWRQAEALSASGSGDEARSLAAALLASEVPLSPRGERVVRRLAD